MEGGALRAPDSPFQPEDRNGGSDCELRKGRRGTPPSMRTGVAMGNGGNGYRPNRGVADQP